MATYAVDSSLLTGPRTLDHLQDEMGGSGVSVVRFNRHGVPDQSHATHKARDWGRLTRNQRNQSRSSPLIPPG